ncbi:MAG TPA: FAD-binding oxidoreductase [Myxococcota bacterium]|nr:FAD-binding oxidoreductase [Myxococcota bacterium]
MSELSGWGRYPVVDGVERVSEDFEVATAGAALSRGLGRSYGDASLPGSPGDVVANSRRADRLLAFDPATGVLRAEAGLSLRELNRTFLRRGFASPVSPGTQYVTLGGMVASDVHGGNHHVAGTFGEHVHGLRMRVADGRVLEISERSEPELFRATLGGMGLTGHILEVEFAMERIPSPWIYQESRQVRDLDQLVESLLEASRTWPFTKSWFDSTKRGPTMGRGFSIVGRWAQPGEAPAHPPELRERISVPVDPPFALVNALSVPPFNSFMFHKHGSRTRAGVVHPRMFFWPLDEIRHWNRLYGPRGFAQYQCVLPIESDTRVVRRFFGAMTRRGCPSPVSVMKDCGAEGRGMLSFPKPGISIAVDVPLRGAKTQALIDALNEIVLEAGGRIYLSKDVLTRADHFRAMEPRLPGWNAVRRKWDPEGRLRSALSVRLLGDAA